MTRPNPNPASDNARYRVRVWPPANDTLVSRNESVRGGDDLMRAGLFIDDGARESAVRGDFQARLFELEAI